MTARAIVVSTVLTVVVLAAVLSIGPTVPAVDVDPEFAGEAANRLLAWVDRHGQMTLLPTPPRGYVYPRLSPDGRQVVVDVRDARHGLLLWDAALDRPVPVAVTAGARATTMAPVWRRDGTGIIFARGRGVVPGLFTLGPLSRLHEPAAAALVATSAEARVPFTSNSLPMPGALRPDDRTLLVTISAASGFDIHAVDLASGRSWPVVEAPADDLNPDVSPDGRWLAYQSRRSGQFEIWLTAWNDNEGRDRTVAGGAPARVDPASRQLTAGGGTRPVWTRGGRELVYLTNEGTMMALPVALPSVPSSVLPAALSPEVVVGRPTVDDVTVGVASRLFTADIYRDLVGRTFDVSADGERLLVIVEP